MNVSIPLRRAIAAAILAGAVAGSAPVTGPVAPASAAVVKFKRAKPATTAHRHVLAVPLGRKVG